MIDILLIGGFISIGVIIASMVIKDTKKSIKIKKHIDSLPEKREERPGVAISNKPPLTGKGQFDKQRTTYTEGDNT
jgi:hypothetical protein